LNEPPVVATWRETQPAVLAPDVGCDFVKLGTRCVSTTHGIIGNDPDAPADIGRQDSLRRPLYIGR